ncbi:MAG: sulfur transferase domain-containing protein [Lysobacterales bacterium]
MHKRYLLIALLCLHACVHAPTAPPPVVPSKPYAASALHTEGLWVGGQPNTDDLATLRQAGVERVLNLRTPEEMQDLGFDEAASASALGLAYRSLPLGGTAYPYTPALVDALEAEMQASKGKLLLHCASGGRAGLVYAAWLVKYRGYTPDAAMRTLEGLGGWPLPLEKLLGRPLRLQYAEG